MGYFDALTSASFKTTADGQKLFYPYGTLGRGYVIPTDSEYEKLQRNYKTVWVITLILIISTILLIKVPFLPLVFLAVFIIGYIIWARLQCRNLAPSTEKLTYGEALTNETHHLGMGFLWFFEILSLLFIVYGVILLLVSPSQWLFSVGLIILFSVIAVIYARMIRTKRRQARSLK